MLTIGDLVFDTIAGANVQIMGQIEIVGIYILQSVQSG